MKNPIQITDHRLQLPSDPAGLEGMMDALKAKEVAFERCVAFTRMLQGAVLAELRKLHGREKGGRPETSKTFGGFQAWSDYVKTRFGISDETARLRIEMWDAGRPRLKKLAEEMQAGLSQIFDRPLSKLSEDEYKALEQVTHKLTDGKSTRMIQEELGLFKLDAAKTPGGKRDKKDDSPNTPDPESAEQKAMDRWASVLTDLDLELKDGSWKDLPQEGPVSLATLKAVVRSYAEQLNLTIQPQRGARS
jgi:hypothetical protein